MGPAPTVAPTKGPETETSIIPALSDSESIGVIVGSFVGFCLLIAFIRAADPCMRKKPRALESPVSSKHLENELLKTDHDGASAPLAAGAPRYREDAGPTDETDGVVFGLPIPGTSPASSNINIANKV